MKKLLTLKILALFTFLLPAAASAQTYIIFNDRVMIPVVISGSPPLFGVSPAGFLPYAPVRVCTAGASGSPCSPLEPIVDLSNNPLTIAPGNFGQVTTNFVGQFQFKCPAGDGMLIQVAMSGGNSPQITYSTSCGASIGTGLLATLPLSLLQNGFTNTLTANVTGARTWTLQDTTDTFVFRNTTDTLTNKTLTGAVFDHLTSTSANPAQTGSIRLASNVDAIEWRNNANSNDIGLSKNTADFLNYGGAGIQSAVFQSSSANPAQSGTLRLASNVDAIEWRNNAGTTDIGISKNASDQLIFNGNQVLDARTAGSCAAGSAATTVNVNSAPTCAAFASGATKVQALIITTGICTTGGAETKCTSGPYSWPAAFADANYAVTCSAANPTGGGTNPGMYGPYPTTQTASQISVIIQSGSASAAGTVTTGTIWCIGVHP